MWADGVGAGVGAGVGRGVDHVIVATRGRELKIKIQGGSSEATYAHSLTT